MLLFIEFNIRVFAITLADINKALKPKKKNNPKILLPRYFYKFLPLFDAKKAKKMLAKEKKGKKEGKGERKRGRERGGKGEREGERERGKGKGRERERGKGKGERENGERRGGEG